MTRDVVFITKFFREILNTNSVFLLTPSLIITSRYKSQYNAFRIHSGVYKNAGLH